MQASHVLQVKLIMILEHSMNSDNAQHKRNQIEEHMHELLHLMFCWYGLVYHHC